MSANKIILELKSFADESYKKSSQTFFKTGAGQYSEFDQFIGVRVPKIRLIAKQHYPTIALNEVGKLLNQPIHEIRHCGLIILVYQYQAGRQQKVFDYYLQNINSVNNWDLVDGSAAYIIGDYLLNQPDNLPLLSHWAISTNLWKRRIAIIATFAFIKHNKFTPTLVISKQLLNDKEDLIHKAIGWMLREIYKKDALVCQNFLEQNYAQLPRTTLRYAIERMPKETRLNYLKGIF